MIVLASKSPRRKELMTKYITSHFSIIPSTSEIEVNPNLSPLENVKIISKAKGEEVLNSHPQDCIISCDTIVILNNEIFGKPKDKNDCYKMMKQLSDKTHEVITYYWIYYKDHIISNYVSSFVTFNELDEEDIIRYINSDVPYDKAGGYGIQNSECQFMIKGYQGSLNNIIGFPVEEIKKDLESLHLV